MINQNCETIAGHFSLDQSVPRYCPVTATSVVVFDNSNSAGCHYICDEHAQVLFYGKATFTLYSVQRLPVDKENYELEIGEMWDCWGGNGKVQADLTENTAKEYLKNNDAPDIYADSQETGQMITYDPKTDTYQYED